MRTLQSFHRIQYTVHQTQVGCCTALCTMYCTAGGVRDFHVYNGRERDSLSTMYNLVELGTALYTVHSVQPGGFRDHLVQCTTREVKDYLVNCTT